MLTSTRQVYGRPEQLPVDESHPTRPVDVNGIHKLAAEQLHLLYGTRARVAADRAAAHERVRTDGSASLKDGLGVLPVFVRQALRGEIIRLYGDGSQRRDCLHVDDVVTALAIAADDRRRHR